MQNFVKNLVIVSLMTSATLLGACKKGDDAGKKMAEFKDKMCGCADKKDGAGDCAKKVTDEMTKWATDNAGKADTAAKPTDEQVEIGKKLAECTTKAMMAGMTMPPPPTGSATMTPPPAGSAATPTETATTPPAAGGVTIASSDDYKKHGEELFKGMSEAFEGDDCDKVADSAGKFIDAHKGDFESLKSWEKTHKDDEKAFEAAHKDDMKKMMDQMGKLADKCKTNAAFKATMSKIPE
jgi:hypothetical protein|nr:hypothetical protein [Kofleriaceae bacterium]